MVNDPGSARSGNLPTYIVDAHALYWWYTGDSLQLSPAAEAAFRLAESGQARVLVPAIVVAEVYFLTLKRRKPIPPSRLLLDMEKTPNFELSPLDRAQLEALQSVDDVPEIHDRLIAADGLVHGAPVITRDVSLHQAKSIRAIW